MLLTVPTYQRHSNGEAQTFANVPRDVPLTLVCREEESAQYADLLAKLSRHHDTIWAIPPGAVSGIATTRQWIMRRAISEGHDRVVMMDDDLHVIVRGKIPEGEPGWDYKLRPVETAAEFQELMSWFDETLLSRAHAAVSMREGNNRIPGLGAVDEANRGIRMVGYSLVPFREGLVRFRPEVEGREDLDMTLQLLRLGWPNVVTYRWAQGQRSAGADGGLSGSRTVDDQDRTARRLAELHPGLVKLRTKSNVSGAMAGERTEVTIFWKRALEEGRHNRQSDEAAAERRYGA